MDRFSILRRYSCSTPSKLYHQRTIRFTLVRSTPHRLFSCSFKTCFLIYDIELSSSFFYCLLQYFFSRTIYVFLLYPSFSIRMSLDTFFICFVKTFRCVFYHSFKWNGSDKLASAGGCTSPGSLHLGKVTRHKSYFRRSSYEVIAISIRASSNQCSTKISLYCITCHRGF